MNCFMTLAGPVEDPAAVVDEIMMSAFASDFSQSNAFAGHVSSFQYLIQQANTDYRKVGSSLESMFTQLFNRYFPVVDITCRTRILEDDPGRIGIRLSGTLTTASGSKLDLAAQLLTANGLVVKMLVGERTLWQA